MSIEKVKEIMKSLAKNSGCDGVLREFINHERWWAALPSCQAAINDREREIRELKELQDLLHNLNYGEEG